MYLEEIINFQIDNFVWFCRLNNYNSVNLKGKKIWYFKNKSFFSINIKSGKIFPFVNKKYYINKKYFYRYHKLSTTNKTSLIYHPDNLRKLEELISYLWVIKFAKNEYNHLLYPCVRWGISLSYKIWKQRKIIGSIKTKIELMRFLNAVSKEIDLMTFYKNYPLHFFIFLYIKLNLLIKNG